MTGHVVYLGNHRAVEVHHIEDETGKIVGQDRRPVGGKQRTTVSLPDGMPLVEALTNITHPQGVWAYHSDAETPAWVASTWPELAAALAAHYGCERREPETGV